MLAIRLTHEFLGGRAREACLGWGNFWNGRHQMADPKVSRRWSRGLPRLSVPDSSFSFWSPAPCWGWRSAGLGSNVMPCWRSRSPAALSITIGRNQRISRRPTSRLWVPIPLPQRPNGWWTFSASTTSAVSSTLPCQRRSQGPMNLWHKWVNSPVSALNLRRTGVTDAGLSHLAALTSLRGLELGETAISDAGMRTWGD